MSAAHISNVAQHILTAMSQDMLVPSVENKPTTFKKWGQFSVLYQSFALAHGLHLQHLQPTAVTVSLLSCKPHLASQTAHICHITVQVFSNVDKSYWSMAQSITTQYTMWSRHKWCSFLPSSVNKAKHECRWWYFFWLTSMLWIPCSAWALLAWATRGDKGCKKPAAIIYKGLLLGDLVQHGVIMKNNSN